MLLPAHTKLGPYEIDTLIGSGETGEVYKAIDARLNRTVAIKMLTGPDASRLEREARTIAALNNPHVCAIYDIGSDYIVMEFVEGKPLKGPLPLREGIRLATQIASALEAAHDAGVTHGDLKPDNILVMRGHVKLLDFGHAHHVSMNPAKSRSGAPHSGTPYVSPEQAAGDDPDARSDVFSFGAVLYEMLSGRRAFIGKTTLE